MYFSICDKNRAIRCEIFKQMSKRHFEGTL